MLQADHHWDNPDCNRDLLKKHLDQAKERNAPVLCFGDLFCAMQGKWDKRGKKSAVRPEHQGDNYLDSLVDTAVSWFKPYAKNLAVVGVGNHEQSIVDRHEVNLIERFVGGLNSATGASIHNGGFAGWVMFNFTRPDKTHIRNRSIVLHYDHGYGGGGPVTADMIQHQRRAVYLPDADFIVSGHTHDSWQREFARTRIDLTTGAISTDVQTHLKLPTYKDEYKDGFGSWAATKGMPPKPLGGYWLRFTYRRNDDIIVPEIIKAN